MSKLERLEHLRRIKHNNMMRIRSLCGWEIEDDSQLTADQIDKRLRYHELADEIQHIDNQIDAIYELT